MKEFIVENWVHILTLSIAAIGGIPGILSTISHFKSSSKLSISIAPLIFGNLEYESKQYVMIFLSLTVTNEGGNVLSPNYFDLSFEINNKWIDLQRFLIPENASFNSNNGQSIKINEPWKRDLQRFNGPIPHGVPVPGHLMFITDAITLDELSKINIINFKLKCIDILKKKHITTFTHTSGPLNENINFPKHGVSIEKEQDA